MKYKDNSTDTRSHKICYLLMSDTIDRLDTILLELRHLQRNIIYFMHEPNFNAPLRFEEEFLWGEEWKTSFPHFATDKVNLQDIILFPDPDRVSPSSGPFSEIKKEEEDKEKRNKLREKIENNLKATIYKLWHEDEWGIRYKRNYEHLRGTQLFKRLIVKDKIKFLRFALNRANLAAGPSTADINPAVLAQFVILRDAIQQRSRQYLKRLVGYQSLFNKTLDIGVKDFPVPSLERRREIGIYMDFLNNRIQGVNKQTGNLVRYLFTNKNGKYSLPTLQKKDKDILLHSWKHHFTCEHHFQKKGDNYKDLDLGSQSDDNQNLHHITTNYWMPERFDLQPIIAHEIAHLVIHQHFDNLSDNFLQCANESRFADLIRSLFRVCRRYTFIEDLSPVHRARFLLTEITCDLLACSVKGLCYLYASLLENLGIDLCKHLVSGNLEFIEDISKTIDLNMIDFISGTGGHPSTMRRDWWLRLKVMVYWLKKIHHRPHSGLDNILLEGTESLLDNLMVFLDEITPQPEKKTGAIWHALAERLCEEIEDSGAAKQVKAWRKERSKAGQKEDTEIVFPRSVERMNKNVVNTLKKIHMGMKLRKGKALYDFATQPSCNSLEEAFDQCYLIDGPDEDSRHGGESEKEGSENYIYNHLYDIPWKCALMRSIDLFGKSHRNVNQNSWLKHYKNSPKKDTLDILHHDNAIGRELYILALEFHMLDGENPIDRLIHTNQLITHLSKKKNSLKKYITEWSDGTTIDWCKTAGKIQQESRKSRKEDKVGENKKKDIRKQEKEAEKHLINLLTLLDKINDAEEKEILMPLRNYLGLYANNKDDVISSVLEAITHIHNNENECSLRKEGQNNVKCFRMLLVSRYMAGGFYAMQNSDNNISNDLKSNQFFTPVRLLSGDSYWFFPPREEQNEWKCCYPFDDRKYSNLSGRYDAMSFVRTRQMRHCSLPHFETKITDEKELSDAEIQDIKPSQYVFPSILTRREFAIKVDLNFAEECTPYITTGKIMKGKKNGLSGYISVVLKRRSLRIPFLTRLMASAEIEDKEFSNKRKDSKLTDHIKSEKRLSNYLRETDSALLLDGSADLLLVLRQKGEDFEQDEGLLKRVEAVINLAYWLHQDFMVDRTEIMLAAYMLDSVADDIAENSGSEYTLECEIRCFEDRFLDASVENFIFDIKEILWSPEQINNNEENRDKSNGKKQLLVTVEIAAGRKDLLLRFLHIESTTNQDDKKSSVWKFNEFREDLAQLLSSKDSYGIVDRIEVNVNTKKTPTLEEECQ